MSISDSVQFNLRQKDLLKASDLFGIEMSILERLNAQRILNAVYIRNLLIRADYERLTSGLHWLEQQDKKYRFPEVMRALAQEYNVSQQNLKDILHGRNETIVFCNRCGVRITKQCHTRTGGLCSNCFADTLEL